MLKELEMFRSSEEAEVYVGFGKTQARYYKTYLPG